MKQICIFFCLAAAVLSFAIEQELTVPRTHIGDDAIACRPETAPQVTNGFATWFEDNTYAC